MSFQGEAEAAPVAAEERGGFFIGSDAEDAPEEQEQQQHELILQKANALAAGNCLKEAIDLFSVAMRYGPVRPEQLSTFADCILRNFKSKAAAAREAASARSGDAKPQREEEAAEKGKKKEEEDLFSCPSCHRFLGEPVTAACGHSYCRRCLQRRFFTKCKRCGGSISGEEKVNVVLSGLLDKWFPEDVRRSKSLHQVDELCRRKLYHDAVSLAGDLIHCGECLMHVFTRDGGEWDGAHAHSQGACLRVKKCPVLLLHFTRRNKRVLLELLCVCAVPVGQLECVLLTNISPHRCNSALCASLAGCLPLAVT